MESKSKEVSLKIILSFIALGIWIMVLQNIGVIPVSQKRVWITNSEIDVRGSVDIDGGVEINNTVDVNIENTVDVNIAEINGYNEVTTGRGTHSVFPYGYMLPVDNW